MINKGFTLVETMVAIAILMIAILGPMDIASSGLRDSMFARDQATAYYLAQEGIEYIRYVRDYNFLKKSPDWLTGLTNCEDSTGSNTSINCTIDSVYFFSNSSGNNPANYISNCGSSCVPLNLDSNDTYTQQNGGSVSLFTRTIKIIPINGTYDREVQIRSTVSFQSRSRAVKTFTITENMSNLYQTN